MRLVFIKPYIMKILIQMIKNTNNAVLRYNNDNKYNMAHTIHYIAICIGPIHI